MAAEGLITITIDDTALQLYIAELRQAINMSQEALGTRSVTRGIAQVKKDADALQFTLTPVIDQNEILMHQLAAMGATDLPGVNRELRLILGQAPGMRSLIMAYFRIKRLQRGLGQFVETGASLQLSLTLIATAIILLKSAISYQQNIERKQRDYELFIRRERGWTAQEFIKGRANWEEFYRSLPG